MSAFDSFRARLSAIYALSVYLPVSQAAQAQRRLSRTLRGKSAVNVDTRLAQTGWSDVLANRPIRLVETEKRHGNVRPSELAILAQAAAQIEPGGEIVEIGTFDGRTTLNIAVNAPERTRVVTLDLPDNHPTQYAIEASERTLVQKPASGERIRSCAPAWRAYAGNITLVFGDSASFDWSLHHARAGLVFVDGSHAYEYARSDSETAFRLARPGCMVIWHDYGVWPGVTRALEELEAGRHIGLKHIRGTSLVFWRAPAGDK